MDIVKSLRYLVPRAVYTVTGNDYAGIDWLDTEIPKPTEAELEAAYVIVLAQESAADYEKQREDATPSPAALLDMIWRAMDDEVIPVAPDFYDAIKAVKDRFP